MTPSHFTLSDLERSKSRSLRFQSFVPFKAAELGHMLLLNINHVNRKAYIHDIWGVYWCDYIWSLQ